MATYINYGEGPEDATVQGAEWLQGMIDVMSGPEASAEFTRQFQELHSAYEMSNRLPDYGPVFDLFVNYSEGLFALISDARCEERIKEVESFFALVLSMIISFENFEHLDRVTTRLCGIFSGNVEQQPELRLRLLMMLYNTFSNPAFEFRYRVFKYTLDFSAKAKLFDQVLPYLEYLDSWMADWNLSNEEQRVLFRDISRYLRDLGKKLDAFLYLKRYHTLFEGCDLRLMEPDVLETTIQLIEDAVQLPSVIQFDDIVGFPAVKALAGTNHSDLIELCEVFLTGDINDLRIFKNQHPKVFEDHDISFEEAMSKTRLLTLATLVQGKSEITLPEVAKALEESEDNVERWVVRAISEGVIDGRIDQLNHKVLVKSAFQRQFCKKDWMFLDTKLSQWIDNLENVVKFIGDQKIKKDSQI